MQQMHSRHAGTSIEGPFWSSSLVPQLVQKPRKTSYNVRQCCIWLQQISLDSHLAWSMLAANMAGRAASSHASSISGPASRRQLKTLASTGKLDFQNQLVQLNSCRVCLWDFGPDWVPMRAPTISRSSSLLL